jgi:hypothetical protein
VIEHRGIELDQRKARAEVILVTLGARTVPERRVQAVPARQLASQGLVTTQAPCGLDTAIPQHMTGSAAAHPFERAVRTSQFPRRDELRGQHRRR